MDMLIGSTAEFYWLNYEEIHIVGCPMYMENYVKIIIRARKHPSNFSLFVPLFPGPSLLLRFRGSLISSALFSGDGALTTPVLASPPPHTNPLKAPPRGS